MRNTGDHSCLFNIGKQGGKIVNRFQLFHQKLLALKIV